MQNYLRPGDLVLWKGRTKEKTALFDKDEGKLVACFDGEPKIFSSPSAFAEWCALWQNNWKGSKPSVSGWERCKVLRGGSWIKLNDLVSSKKKKRIVKTSKESPISKELPPEIQRLINEFAKPLCRLNWRRSITPSCTALYESNEYSDYRCDVHCILIGQDRLMGLAADAAAFGSFEETLEYIEEQFDLTRNDFLVTENTTWYQWCCHNGILLDDFVRKCIVGDEEEDIEGMGNYNNLLQWHVIDNEDPMTMNFGYDQGYQYKKRAGYGWSCALDSRLVSCPEEMRMRLNVVDSWRKWAITNSSIDVKDLGKRDRFFEKEIQEKLDATGFGLKNFKKLMKNLSKPNDFARWYRR